MRVPVSTVLVGTLILSGLSSPARSQSLGELARREAERRKNLKDDGKVLTNKDVRRVAQPEVPPASADTSAAATPAPATDTDAKPEATETRDQKYWAERQQALKTQLERDEMFAAALQSRINVLTADFAGRDDPAQRALIGVDRQRALDELERVKVAIDADKKALADFEEEARRASVPPGWLR